MARSKQRQLHDQQASHGNLNKEHSITRPGLAQSKQRQAHSPSISPHLRPGLKPNQPGRNLDPNHQTPRPPSAIMKPSGPIDRPVQGDDRQDVSICAAIQNPPPASQLYMAASLPCSAAPMTRRRGDPPCGKREIESYGWLSHWPLCDFHAPGRERHLQGPRLCQVPGGGRIRARDGCWAGFTLKHGAAGRLREWRLHGLMVVVGGC